MGESKYARELRTAPNILTPRVRVAQHELLAAIGESIRTSGLLRDEAEARTSALLSDIWTEAERTAPVAEENIPRPDPGRSATNDFGS